jgi:GTPase SAR1 family protein
MENSKYDTRLFIPSEHVFTGKKILAIAASGSGKTTLVHNLLYHLIQEKSNNDKYEFYACNGSEAEEPSYSNIAYSSFIRSSFDEEFLMKIIKIQQQRAKSFNTAFSYIDKELFPEYAHRKMKKEKQELIERLDAAKEEAIENHKEYYIEKLEQIFNKYLISLYRKFLKYYVDTYDVSETIINICKGIYKNIQVVIVIDDCQDRENTLRKSSAISFICTKGRRCWITFILCIQYAVSVPPDTRTSMNYIALPIDTAGNQEKVFSEYLKGIFTNRREFANYYNRNTIDNNVFIIKSNVRSTNLSDRLFHFKPMKLRHLPAFKIGSEKQKKLHKEHIKKYI